MSTSRSMPKCANNPGQRLSARSDVRMVNTLPALGVVICRDLIHPEYPRDRRRRNLVQPARPDVEHRAVLVRRPAVAIAALALDEQQLTVGVLLWRPSLPASCAPA